MSPVSAETLIINGDGALYGGPLDQLEAYRLANPLGEVPADETQVHGYANMVEFNPAGAFTVIGVVPSAFVLPIRYNAP